MIGSLEPLNARARRCLRDLFRAFGCRPGARIGRIAPATLALALVVCALAITACTAGAPTTTPSIVPGNATVPREVNLIAKDYAFLPVTLDLVPGETVLLHVVNGGLDIHEAVIGGAAVQDAWEKAEQAAAGAPPGPMPVLSVPPDLAGLRIVVASGQRVDVVLTVPDATEPWTVGCHIPGHMAKGMHIPVRWVRPGTQ